MVGLLVRVPRSTAVVLVALVVAMAGAFPVSADTGRWTEVADVKADAPIVAQLYGYSIDLDGAVAAIGAPGPPDTGWAGGEYIPGSVYLYERSRGGWSQMQSLSAPDGYERDLFGRSVTVDGDVLAVAGDAEGRRGGAAYLFRSVDSHWVQTAKLVASAAEAGDQFGATVAVSGNRLAVSAPGDDDGGENAGAIYVFEFDGRRWRERAKLATSNGDHIGGPVALDGNTIVAGSWRADDSVGAVYTFTDVGSHWIEQKLTVPDADTLAYFGYSVSIDGETIVVGAPLDYEMGPNAGAAYTFVPDENGMWQPEARLLASDAMAYRDFGIGVAIEGDTIVVGQLDLYAAGGLYVFERQRGVWLENAKLTVDEEIERDFGATLALSSGTILAGARLDSREETYSGAAYFFGRRPQR